MQVSLIISCPTSSCLTSVIGNPVRRHPPSAFSTSSIFSNPGYPGITRDPYRPFLSAYITRADGLLCKRKGWWDCFLAIGWLGEKKDCMHFAQKDGKSQGIKSHIQNFKKSCRFPLISTCQPEMAPTERYLGNACSDEPPSVPCCLRSIFLRRHAPCLLRHRFIRASPDDWNLPT